MQFSEYWIERLGLIPHPEGGYYKEMYRSNGIIPKSALPESFSGSRNYATSIYYLLTQNAFSAFHRILQDEIWHFYYGSSIILHCITPQSHYYTEILGVKDDASPMAIIPAGTFFAAESTGGRQNTHADFSLAGCTVAPGFDFQDFVMPTGFELIELFPQHTSIINRFTQCAKNKSDGSK